MSDSPTVLLRASHQTDDTQLHFCHSVADQTVFVVDDVVLDDPTEGPYQVARVGVRCGEGLIRWIATTAAEARSTKVVCVGSVEWIVSFVDHVPTTPTLLRLRTIANTDNDAPTCR